MGHRLRLVMLACAMASAAAQAAPAPAPADTPAAEASVPAKRPLRVGLVLSGGGARGFAHVGVLKVLEEAGVKVSVITATSMGSMVGGAYAEGYSPDQIRRIVASVDWQKMFAPKPSRKDMNWRRKEDKDRGLSDAELGISEKGFALPYGLIRTQELDLFLARVNEPASQVDNLAKLPVPYAAFATDLELGKPVKLQKNISLSQAMRASMSIPGAFSPAEWNGMLLVDGGLVQNLPVSEARKMGADVVIAVNVGTPLSKKDSLGSLAGVMGQMLNILTEQNVQKSLSELGPDDILITPDLEKYTSGDFDRYGEIIRAGEEAARAVLPRLRALAAPAGEFSRWRQERREFVEIEGGHRVADVRVDNLRRVNSEAVLQDIPIKPGDTVTTEEVQDAARGIWQSDDFLSVPYRFEPGPDGMEVLVFEPQEKTWGYSAFRVGGRVQTNFSDDNTFDFMVEHTLGWLNPWGGELKTGLQIGENSGFRMEFYQPLGMSSPFYLRPRIELSREDYDVYIGHELVDTWQNRTYSAEVELGWELSRYGRLSLSSGFEKQKNNRIVGVTADEISNTRSWKTGLQLNIDRLDSVTFPTSGYRFHAGVTRYWDGMGRDKLRTAYDWNAMAVHTVGNWTFQAAAMGGVSEQEGDLHLGGAFRLTGSSYGRYSGDRMIFGRLMVYRNLSERLKQIGAPVWAGISLEAGRAYNKHDGYRPGWQKAGGAFIGADTWFGPIYLVSGRTLGGSAAAYLVWGHIF